MKIFQRGRDPDESSDGENAATGFASPVAGAAYRPLVSPSPIKSERERNASVFSFLWSDLVGDNEDIDVGESSKRQLLNFFRVPLELEKTLGIIFLVLLDHLLFVFSVLPMRILISLPMMLWSRALSQRRIYDIFKGGIIVVTALVISHYFDFGVCYHFVKAQSVIKVLYSEGKTCIPS